MRSSLLRPGRYLRSMGWLPVEALSHGYIAMLADVHFRTGSSHSDMLECVEAATKKVIEMEYADPAPSSRSMVYRSRRASVRRARGLVIQSVIEPTGK